MPKQPADALPRLLLAEDEADLRSTMALVLQAAGYDVVAVAGTEEALAQLQAGRFDVVVSDVTMPGGGGRAVYAAALELPEPPPVVLVSGHVDDAEAARLLPGCSALLKPFGLTQLVEAVLDARGCAG